MMAYRHVLDDPFASSEYSIVGRNGGKNNRKLAKTKQTKSVEVLRRSKQNFNSATRNPSSDKVRKMKKSCMLKLRPVQPRKKKICLKEMMKLIGSTKSISSPEEYSQRMINSPEMDERSMKLFSPQTENKGDQMLLLSVEYEPQQNTDRNTIAYDEFRNISSAYENYEMIHDAHNERAKAMIFTPTEDKFIQRVSKGKSDGISTRVSTIDTNNMMEKDSQDQNFLANSRKRVKNTSNRYFNIERVSLPQIRAISQLNNESPFSSKKISCNQRVEGYDPNGLNEMTYLRTFSNEEVDSKMNHYYYQPTRRSKKLLSPRQSSDCSKIPFLKRTRNMAKNSSNSSKILRNVNPKLCRGHSFKKLVFNSTLMDRNSSVLQEIHGDKNGDSSMNLSKKIELKEPPCTPSFPNRQE